jgi:hypothetical protein
VTITFGKPFEVFPWIVAENHAKPAEDVLVLVKIQSGRIRITTGRYIAGWEVNFTGVSVNKTLKVIAWHPNGIAIDTARSWKAIRWVEKHYGLMKMKNMEEWLQQFYQAWKDKPWA